MKEDKILLEDLRAEMVRRKYSPKTITAYIYYNRSLLEFTGKWNRSQIYSGFIRSLEFKNNRNLYTCLKQRIRKD